MTKRYGIVIDLERCVGCHTCTIACMTENDLSQGSGIVVKTIGGKDRDTPEGRHPDLHMHFLPIMCMHCADAPCMAACPSDAIKRRPDGIVLIDEKFCDGCFNCVSACPHGVIVSDEKKESVWKCNMCFSRIDEGFVPFCVLCCEGEAMFFGDLNDPGSDISKKIAACSGQKLLNDSEPAVWYCPTREGRIR
jgi:dimethyl sulfoxide reductase iron-sulfur subunit